MRIFTSADCFEVKVGRQRLAPPARVLAQRILHNCVLMQIVNASELTPCCVCVCLQKGTTEKNKETVVA